MNQKTVLKIVQMIPRLDEGGAERGVLDLVREHQGAAEHIVLSEGGRLTGKIVQSGGRFLPMPVASKNPLTAVWRAARLRKVLLAIMPDIVHVRSRVPAWLHHLANRDLNIPTVSTAHGINSVSAYSRIMTIADAIICPGTAAAEHLQRAYGAASVVIGRGVDLEYFNPDKVNQEQVQQLREQWGLIDKKVVLHVGRLSEQKGHEVLLRALPHLPNEYVAVIAGDGRRRNRLIKLARQLNVAERARFTGARSDIREIYALADIAVSCAIKPESFGRTIAEALAMGIPTIAADHGGARDIINAGRKTGGATGGKLVPVGDSAALASAILSPPDASNSRINIEERFTAKQMADATMKVYRRVLTERRRYKG